MSSCLLRFWSVSGGIEDLVVLQLSDYGKEVFISHFQGEYARNQCTNIRYAGDTGILANNTSNLQKMIHRIVQHSAKFELHQIFRDHHRSKDLEQNKPQKYSPG